MNPRLDIELKPLQPYLPVPPWICQTSMIAVKGNPFVDDDSYIYISILLKTMERCKLFSRKFLQASLLYSLCRDLDGNEIVPYFLRKRSRP